MKTGVANGKTLRVGNRCYRCNQCSTPAYFVLRFGFGLPLIGADESAAHA